ncbi:MAG: hypothetical protein ABIO44_02365 [Saprospiraceae bacterium]
MDDSNNDAKVIEGQVQETQQEKIDNFGVSSTEEPQSQAELVISLTNLINANLVEIDSIEKELARHKEMIDSVLDNDSTYKKHAEDAKEASRIKGNTKKEIFKRADVKHVVEKLTELKENLTDTRGELSNYIQEYATASGQNYFEAEDGTIQEIVYIAKLRRKPS